MTESEARIVLYASEDWRGKRNKPRPVTIKMVPEKFGADLKFDPQHKAKQPRENKPQLFKVAEAAKLLDVSNATAYRLMKSGELPAMRLTERGDMRISKAAIDQYIGKREREESSQQRRIP